jgi:hypothetical protein
MACVVGKMAAVGWNASGGFYGSIIPQQHRGRKIGWYMVRPASAGGDHPISIQLSKSCSESVIRVKASQSCGIAIEIKQGR